MNPSQKSEQMEKEIDDWTQESFGRKRTESIKSDICVICGGESKNFRDELSRKEYIISGMCQLCQDKTFGLQ